ncbi:MAG: hypothetical protein ACJA0H_002269, partial [Francisellaceae bacterium]
MYSLHNVKIILQKKSHTLRNTHMSQDSVIDFKSTVEGAIK